MAGSVRKSECARETREGTRKIGVKNGEAI